MKQEQLDIHLNDEIEAISQERANPDLWKINQKYHEQIGLNEKEKNGS